MAARDTTSPASTTVEVQKSDAEWRTEPTPQQYDVLRRRGTEPQFTGGYVYNKDIGAYRCAAGAGAVRAAVASHRLHYPVGLDNSYASWDAHRVQFWPTMFVLDRHGAFAHRHVGEDGYAQTERAINRLLGEAAPPARDAAGAGSPTSSAA